MDIDTIVSKHHIDNYSLPDLDWDPLYSSKPFFAAHADQLARAFFHFIDEVDELKGILLSIPVSMHHEALVDFFVSLSSPFEWREQRQMVQIGKIHYQIGVPLAWMVHMTNFIVEYVHRQSHEWPSPFFYPLFNERMRWRQWWIMKGFQDAREEMERNLEEEKIHSLEAVFLKSMNHLAEWNDPYTKQHVERVGNYTKWIAEQVADAYKLSPSMIRAFSVAAIVHDVGKVAIPKELLFKPDRLSTGERVNMEEHTIVGRQIIEDMRSVMMYRPDVHTGGSLFQHAMDIAYHHHEWWDGSGYPAKLKGHDIPLSARIVAVADVIDALSTVRPYKLAWSKDEVVEHLQKRSGTQFDPFIVKRVIDRWDEFPFEEDVFLQNEVT